MSNYTNREMLFNEYLNTDPKLWESMMGAYAVEGRNCQSKQYYLSLDSGLENNFVISESYDDIVARNNDMYYQQLFSIPLPQRLLTNTDLQGCWNQFFPRLLECYKMETDYSRPIELYMYEVDLTDCVVIENRNLVENNMIYNAYCNNTHAVFGHPKLKLVERILVANTLAYPDERCTYYYPFNNNRYMQCLLSTPLEILNRISA